MEPLKTTKRVLIWLYMCPTEGNLSRRQKIAHFLFASVIFMVDFAALPPQLTLLFKSMKTNLAEALFALMSVIAIVGTIYAMTSAYRSRQEIGKTFTDLSAIYRASTRFLVKHFFLAVCILVSISSKPYRQESKTNRYFEPCK